MALDGQPPKTILALKQFGQPDSLRRKGAHTMEMSIEAFSDSVTKVVLNGRLDMQGAQKIDLPFSSLAGSHRKVIVDLSQVVFMASMGIRTLVLTAKSIKSKGGRLVLLDPVGEVEKVL